MKKKKKKTQKGREEMMMIKTIPFQVIAKKMKMMIVFSCKDI